MVEQKLNKWAELLLDTGKRNNLINFKDSKMGTVEVIYPDFVSFFSRAEHSAVFEVFDPKLEEGEEFLEEDENTKVEKLSKQDYLTAYSDKLKKQQILVYNSLNKPLQALKNISKKAKSAIEETGVNIAYLAFGFIHWKEKEGGKDIYRAPILLVPISIENESSVEPYHIKVIDDEITVNPTFAFKLQNEFGIKLPDFDEEKGIEDYFLVIQEIVKKLNWFVTTDCKIGLFSFLKINMYNDLKENSKKILKNNNVCVLLGDKGALSNFNSGKAEDYTYSDLHNVVDADSSQSDAIIYAKQGKSFVLQGPPGTGKSQTITNVIAECLADNKKVLFVSEKLAALNVVYEKLKGVGLEEFCLELHSHKANKKQVIAELCHTLRLPKSGVSDKAEKELKIKSDAQNQLDDYVEELHKVRAVINKSLYELINEESACRQAPDMEFVIGNISSKGEEYIDKVENALNRYTDYIPSIGYDYHNNEWYGYKNLDCSFETVIQLKSDLQKVAELSEELILIKNELYENYHTEQNCLNQAYILNKFFTLAKQSEFITPTLINKHKLNEVSSSLKMMKPLAAEILKLKASIDNVFDEDVYKLDGNTLYKKLIKQFDNFFVRLFSSDYRKIATDLKLCKKDGKGVNYKKAVEYVEKLRAYQHKLEKFNEFDKKVCGLFGVAYKGVNTDFDKLEKEIEDLSQTISSGVNFDGFNKIPLQNFADEKNKFAGFDEKYDKLFNLYKDNLDRLKNSFDEQKYNIEDVNFQNLCKKCENLLKNIEKINNWCEFIKLMQTLEELELTRFIDGTIEKEFDIDCIIPAFKKCFYRQWIDVVLMQSTTLMELIRIPHDEAVKKFKEKDELNFEINKAKIKASLSSLRPSLDMIAQGSSIAILLRENEKKRKQKGVRQLISEIGDLIQTLKPCFLMSPLSVSAFLSSDTEFDVVIFDEASQIFPQDAVGTIYRGKQVIVVGDSKQMPPSNFFNAVVDLEDEYEDDDVTDFESILDLCSSTFPQRRLKWHYRSRYEGLIAFSNKNFYDNELVTFPSSKTDKEGIGVDYYYVDGIFDRKTKTNRIEAERVVDLVFENIEKYPERSIGIVAFSISQQTLIDRLIAKRRKQDLSKENFFRSSNAEPFFVKNLETVQGDERDTIIFSVAYAKDEGGKLLLNFGPLNREGGERRLNVAITRAKHNVQLVSSMHGNDIDLSRTESVGARLLKEYLDYAECNKIVAGLKDGENDFTTSYSEFVNEVKNFLCDNGYEVDARVGRSSMKIDLAIKQPNFCDYVLAVECDGETYRDSKSTRDRDRLRQSVLERMGWKYYRIWSTDWFRNKAVEKENLLSAVKNAIQNTVRKTVDAALNISFNEPIIEKHFEFPKYKMVDPMELYRQNKYSIASIIYYMVKQEAPLSEEWLLKRIVGLFGGREKITNVVREQFKEVMRDVERRGVLWQDGFMYLIDDKIPLLRVPESGEEPREIKYIELQELSSGLRELLKQNISASKSGLFKLLAQQLGFARIGDAILYRLEAALRLISDEVEFNGEMLSLK